MVDNHIRELIRERVAGKSIEGADVLSQIAYLQADSMLKAREQ